MRTFRLPNEDEARALRVLADAGGPTWKTWVTFACRDGKWGNVRGAYLVDTALIKAAVDAMGHEWATRFYLRGDIPRWGREKGPSPVWRSVAEHRAQVTQLRQWPRDVRVAVVNARNHSRANACGIERGSSPDWMVDCPVCRIFLDLRDSLSFLAVAKPPKENARCATGRDCDIQRWMCAKARVGDAGTHDPVFDDAVTRLEKGPVPIPRQTCPRAQPATMRLVIERDDQTGRLRLVERAV